MLIISLPGEVRDRLTGVGHAKADKWFSVHFIDIVERFKWNFTWKHIPKKPNGWSSSYKLGSFRGQSPNMSLRHETQCSICFLFETWLVHLCHPEGFPSLFWKPASNMQRFKTESEMYPKDEKGHHTWRHRIHSLNQARDPKKLLINQGRSKVSEKNWR